MSIDLSALSVAELEQLVRDAGQRIEALKRESCAALRRNLEAQAREAGFDIYAMFGAIPTKPSKQSDTQKYRNPQNPEQSVRSGCEPRSTLASHWSRCACGEARAMQRAADTLLGVSTKATASSSSVPRLFELE